MATVFNAHIPLEEGDASTLEAQVTFYNGSEGSALFYAYQAPTGQDPAAFIPLGIETGKRFKLRSADLPQQVFNGKGAKPASLQGYGDTGLYLAIANQELSEREVIGLLEKGGEGYVYGEVFKSKAKLGEVFLQTKGSNMHLLIPPDPAKV